MIPYTALQLWEEDYGDDVEEVSSATVGAWQLGYIQENIYRHDGKLYAARFFVHWEDGYNEGSGGESPYEVRAIYEKV